MFILNQKQDTMINTISYNAVGVSDRKVIALLNEGACLVLGEYSYEGRAKEILQDILKKAELGVNTYFMPKE